MLRDKLLGTWKLISAVHHPADGSTSTHILGRNPIGFIMYNSDGYMSAQITRQDHIVTAADDSKSSTVEHIFYAGPFQTDEEAQAVTHSVEISIDPSWPGTKLMRRASIDGDVLRLSCPDASAGKPGELEISWRRA